MNHASVAPKGLGKGKTIALWVLTGLAVLAYFGAGAAKLAGVPMMVDVFNRVGFGQWFRYLTGVLEIGGAVALLFRPTALYSTALLGCVMVGAFIAHMTVLPDPPAGPIVLGAILGGIAWLRSKQAK